MKTYTLEITEEMLKDPVRGDCKRCPVAQAAINAGLSCVNVGASSMSFDTSTNVCIPMKRVTLPARVQDLISWVDGFRRCPAPKLPVTFTITVGDQGKAVAE